MFDQADRLRQLVRETVQERVVLEPGVPLLAVTAAVPGAGASTLAIHLARELAQFGKRILLVDGHLTAPGLAARLGLSTTSGILDVLDGRKSAVEVLQPVCEAVQLLSGGPTTSVPRLQVNSVHRLIVELRSLHTQADLVIVDLGNGMSPWAERLWSAALQILLVSRCDSRSLLESYATVKAASPDDSDGRMRLVINRCQDTALGNRAGENFAATCREHLGMKLLAGATLLPPDERLEAGEASVSSSSSFSRSLRLLAADVLSQSIAVHSCRSYPISNSTRIASASQAAALLVDASERDSSRRCMRDDYVEKIVDQHQED
jgi:MinD-like ATPase involved in chromosome partitioning or flagellar assembly